MKTNETKIQGAQMNVFGVGVTLLMENEGSESGFTVSCLTCAPGTGAPLHRHVEREAFYVLEGQIILEVNGGEYALMRGDFFQVDSHLPHRFTNQSDKDATVLNFSIPAGHSKFFREADALYQLNQFTREKALEVCKSNGIEILG
ncbi:MAG: cupin domain-containing protein [Verrucomicrobia bacterium]|nr:cupin domain-containing protein [Verrucomicrobiota bacterium]